MPKTKLVKTLDKKPRKVRWTYKKDEGFDVCECGCDVLNYICSDPEYVAAEKALRKAFKKASTSALKQGLKEYGEDWDEDAVTNFIGEMAHETQREGDACLVDILICGD